MAPDSSYPWFMGYPTLFSSWSTLFSPGSASTRLASLIRNAIPTWSTSAWMELAHCNLRLVDFRIVRLGLSRRTG